MEEIIVNVLLASGAIGFISNYMVSSAKYVAKNWAIKVSPRMLNAIASLSGALGVVLSGGEADLATIESSLTVLATAGVAWLVAHITHKVNKV